MSQQYTNEAYQTYPEDEEYNICRSDDNDDVSSDDSCSDVPTNETIRKTSHDSKSTGISDIRLRRKTTKKTTKKIR
ncbi:hypothetical protein DPMN_180646 [Dreissena polymorpha]|uniref:Uncharacterized protein n=1 Tax=Dreissena polymorpha TaxID=45954 RepID=A0A9D4INF5_DREPO|nr:hypothetical protein DPMN_180646 [Dreissena polymorpha]